MRKGYQAWLQSARVADAVAEIEVLKATTSSLLDKHLAKTADQVRALNCFAISEFCVDGLFYSSLLMTPDLISD